MLVHHVRYHSSLHTLDEKMGYVFKDRSLLQVKYKFSDLPWLPGPLLPVTWSERLGRADAKKRGPGNKVGS